MTDEPEIRMLPRGIIGVGAYYPTLDLIFIDEWLLKYPDQYKRVLDHELAHRRICRSGAGFLRRTWENLVLEYRDIPDKARLLAMPQGEKITLSTLFMVVLIDVLRLPGDLLVAVLALGLRVSRWLTR